MGGSGWREEARDQLQEVLEAGRGALISLAESSRVPSQCEGEVPVESAWCGHQDTASTLTVAPALQTGTTVHPCCWTVSSAWAPSWSTTQNTVTGTASTEAWGLPACLPEPPSLKFHPLPDMLRDGVASSPLPWVGVAGLALAHASHVCLHSRHRPASPVVSSPTSSSPMCLSLLTEEMG